MQKVLAHATKKKDGRPFQSTGLTAGISQGLPSACLESRQIGMFGHSQVAKRRGHNFSSCLYQPPSSKPSKSTGPYCQQLSVYEFHASGSGNSVLLQCCVFALGATASAHLHQVVTQVPLLQPALLQGPEHQLQLLGTDWLEWGWLTFRNVCQETLHMGPCPMITECHVCVSFVGRVN